jgi:hypothetical protein
MKGCVQDNSSTTTFLPTLNGVSDEASKMIVDRSDDDDDADNKTKFQPLLMIQKAALYIVKSHHYQRCSP